MLNSKWVVDADRIESAAIEFARDRLEISCPPKPSRDGLGSAQGEGHALDGFDCRRSTRHGGEMSREREEMEMMIVKSGEQGSATRVDFFLSGFGPQSIGEIDDDSIAAVQ